MLVVRDGHVFNGMFSLEKNLGDQKCVSFQAFDFVGFLYHRSIVLNSHHLQSFVRSIVQSFVPSLVSSWAIGVLDHQRAMTRMPWWEQ
jgi:hypothetical protein